MYFRIVFTNYLKNFLMIFISLNAFFIFIDFMINRTKLPDSFNLKLLYVIYNSFHAAILIYPLSLLLALLVLVVNMVKKDEMIAFMSIGYSLKKLLIPVASLAVLVFMFFILVQVSITTSFQEKAEQILKGNYNTTEINHNLFFKFNNNIIFIKELDVLHKTAYDMKIFVLNDNKVKIIYQIKRALFKNNYWEASSIKEYVFFKNIFIEKNINLHLLKGFKPDILNKLETKQSMTLRVAFQALMLLKKENININFIKTYIYEKTIPPLSFILLIIIVFLKAPIHSRISRVSLYIAISLFFSIVLWGLYLIVSKMSKIGIISPDLLFLTPFITLLGIAIYYFRKI